MRTFIRVVILSAIGVLLSACASQPNQHLEQARVNVADLQNNPQARELAPVETRDAQNALQRAERAASGRANQAEVDHQAYLVNQRVALANQTILWKDAEQQLRQMSSERAQVRLDARDAQISARDAELRAREAEIRRLQDELEAKQTERGSVVTLGDVLFEFDKADLMPAAGVNIERLAAFLTDNPERKVLVEGFTDNVGSDSYNLNLSQQRADSVRHALVRAGVEPGRIMTTGLGKAHPVASNDDSTGRAMNRRVEVTISHDTDPVPPRR